MYMPVPSASCPTAWFETRGCTDDLMSFLPSESYHRNFAARTLLSVKSRCGAVLLSDLGDLDGLLTREVGSPCVWT